MILRKHSTQYTVQSLLYGYVYYAAYVNVHMLKRQV